MRTPGSGRKRWEPTEEEAGRIYEMALMGMTDAEIARLTKKPERTLRFRCSEILARGREIANGQVVAALFKKAIGGDTVAQIFWTKTRLRKYGWGEDQQDTNINITTAPPMVFFEHEAPDNTDESKNESIH